MWILPLYLHINKKSDDDDDLIICFGISSSFQYFSMFGKYSYPSDYGQRSPSNRNLETGVVLFYVRCGFMKLQRCTETITTLK